MADKKINRLDSHEYLVLTSVSDGGFKPSKEEAEYMEVITPKMLRKISIDLINRGWINVSNGKYKLSSKGKKALSIENKATGKIRKKKK